MNLSTVKTLTPLPLRKFNGLLSPARTMALALDTIIGRCRRSDSSFSRKRVGGVLALVFLLVVCAETKSQIPNASPGTQLISAASLSETRQPSLILPDKRSGDDLARSGPKGSSVLRSLALLPIRLLKAVAGVLNFGEGKSPSTPAPAKTHDDPSVLAHYDTGKPIDWVPVKFEVDGKEKHERYKILLYLKDGQSIEPLLVDGGFIVPPEVKSAEYVTVRFLSRRYDFSFGEVYPIKFETDWTIGVDTKPFDSENVWDDEKAKNTRIVYYINFEPKDGDGTRAVRLVPINDSTSKSSGQETSNQPLAIGGTQASTATTGSTGSTSASLPVAENALSTAQPVKRYPVTAGTPDHAIAGSWSGPAQKSGGKSQAMIRYPRLLHAELPLYPPIAWTAKITGTVEAEVTVKNGVVTNIDVKSSVSLALTNPTIRNIRTWQFGPQDSATFRVKYVYEIKGKETLEPETPRVELELPRLVRFTAKPFKPTCSDCPVPR
jgi:TonB-like protein